MFCVSLIPVRFYAIQGCLDSNPLSFQCSIYINIANICSAVNHELEYSHADYPEYEIDVKLCVFTASEMKEAEHEYKAFKQVVQPVLINTIGSMSDAFFIWMRKKLSETGW